MIHGNQTNNLPGHYVRYLEKTFRRVLKLHGTPIRLQFKTGDNPYEKKASSERQRIRQRRLENSREIVKSKRKNNKKDKK